MDRKQFLQSITFLSLLGIVDNKEKRGKNSMGKQPDGKDLVGDEYVFSQATNYYSQRGLTKKELFAAIALHGLITKGAIPDKAVNLAWDIADQMVKKANEEGL